MQSTEPKLHTTLSEESVTADVEIETPEKAQGSKEDGTKSEIAIWSSVDDPRRPRNWSLARKWGATVILSAVCFVQPLSETPLTPLKYQISQDLGIKYPYQWILVNSLILVGIGLSSLFLAPLSEYYGRKPILLLGMAFSLAWNTGCGAAMNLDQLLALRFFSGFGASVGDAVGPGVLSDIWRAELRGRAFAVYLIVPLLGTAIGPIYGSYISTALSWRWAFWVASIFSAVTIIVTITFLPETYEPKIERTLRAKLQAKSPDGHCARQSHSPRQGADGLVRILADNIQRPFRLLGTQLIVQLLAIYMALLYGIMWLFLFIFPRLWDEQYQQNPRTASLNYLSFGIGLAVGGNIAGHLSDFIYSSMKRRNKGVGRPEYRVPTMIIGTVCAPLGLVCWGWSGAAKAHWIVPNIGSFFFALGVYACSICVSVYTIDTYTRYAASAISTNLVLRSITSAFFPVFAPYMFDSVGFGFGATILASGFLGIGSIIMCVLWFYGQKLRAMSPYCAIGDADLDRRDEAMARLKPEA